MDTKNSKMYAHYKISYSVQGKARLERSNRRITISFPFLVADLPVNDLLFFFSLVFIVWESS